MAKELKKLNNDIWFGIWTEYHSGPEGRANAMLRMLLELEHMISGYVTQARNCGGHLSTDAEEDFRQTLCLKLIQLLDTYDPSKGRFSTYAHLELTGCLGDFRRGGDGNGTAPVSNYNARKGRMIHMDSFESMMEREETRDYVLSRASAPSAEEEFFNSLIPEDILEFREYINSLPISDREKKKKWRLFAALRELA